MPDYRRRFVPGGMYFFTVVTHKRRPLFCSESARRFLGEAMRTIAVEQPFETIAIVLLWDHCHCIWSLPPTDHDFSTRWKKIKRHFTTAWLNSGGEESAVTQSQARRGHRGVWQRRFWEHLIRDEDDLERHFDYIHLNPVKHGFVTRPTDWPWSSFHRFVQGGQYPANWGSDPATIDRLNRLDWE